MSEQMDNLRRAEASLQDAEKRLTMVRKWQPALQHAVLEYHASVQRLKDLAATDVPTAVTLLTRLVDALEAYLRVQPPSGTGLEPAMGRAAPELEAIASRILDEPVAVAVAEPPSPAEDPAGAEPPRPVEAAEAPASAVESEGGPQPA
jgi:hypothetical protein